jgi:hypothetical protein
MDTHQKPLAGNIEKRLNRVQGEAAARPFKANAPNHALRGKIDGPDFGLRGKRYIEDTLARDEIIDRTSERNARNHFRGFCIPYLHGPHLYISPNKM